MGSIKDIFKYTGGLNRDDEDRVIPKGDVRNALNVRSSTSDTDNSNSVNFVISDLEIDVSSVLPSLNTHTPLGYAEDVENNNVFLFYYSVSTIIGSLITGSIVKLNKTNNTLSLVMSVSNSTTKFSKHHLINHANVVGDFLLWTDGNVPPRKINHLKALKFTESNGTDPEGYSVIDEQTITAIKHPPSNKPEVYFKKVSTITFVVAYSVLENNLDLQGSGSFTYKEIDKLSDDNNEFTLFINDLTGSITISYKNGLLNITEGIVIYAKPSDSTKYYKIKKIDTFGTGNVENITISYSDFYNNYLNSLENEGDGNDTRFFGDGFYGQITNPYLEPESKPSIIFDETVLRLKNDLQSYYFSTSFIYGDYEKSTASPYSEIPLTYDNNYLSLFVRFKTGHKDVKSIILYGRNGRNGNWFKVKKFDKYDTDGNVLIESDSTYTYEFTTDEFEETVDQVNFVRPFDYVPRLAKTQEVLSSGNLAYGNYLEGYNPTSIDMDLELIQTDSLIENVTYMSYDALKLGEKQFFLSNFQLENYNGGVIPVIGLFNSKEGIEYLYKGISFGVIEDIPKAIPNSSEYNYNGTDGILVNTQFSNEESDWEQLPLDQPTFKTGGRYKIGVIYYDEANRSSSVNVFEGNSISVPFYNENQPFKDKPGVYQTWYRNMIKWELKNQPPVWATRYQVVYTDCLDVAEAIHIVITGRNDNAEDEHISDVDYLWMHDNITDRNLNNYTFQEGDRIRFICSADTSDDYGPGNFEMFDSYVDIEVLGFDVSTKKLQVYKSEYPITGTGNDRFIVEIYRPIKELENVIYRERGQEYEIGNPGQSDRYHKGHLSDQNPLNPSSYPATGILYKGDFYKRKVNLFENGSRVNSILDESKSISTFTYNDVYNYGRINIQSDTLTEKWFKNSLRHGGKFLPETQINDLLRFDFNDKTDVPEKYGEITRVIEVGFTLKVLQKYNIASVYIQRTQTLDSEGQTNLALTNTIFGTVNPSTDNYGCQHPESVRKLNRDVYFFDANNGVVVRNSPNGSIPISDAKMVSYFRDKGKEASQNNSIRVIGNIDKEYKEYIISFINSSNDETIAFNEDQNRWKTFYSYIPEITANIGDQSYVLISDKLYKMNAGDTYGSLAGNQRDMEIEFVMNEVPQKVKVFESVAVNSNLPFSLPEITIPAKQSNNNQVRQSRLIESKFERKEGVYYAELLKDLNTPNFSTQLLALINGDEMRGQSIKFKLVYQGNEGFVMDSFLLHANPSELSL